MISKQTKYNIFFDIFYIVSIILLLPLYLFNSNFLAGEISQIIDFDKYQLDLFLLLIITLNWILNYIFNKFNFKILKILLLVFNYALLGMLIYLLTR